MRRAHRRFCCSRLRRGCSSPPWRLALLVLGACSEPSAPVCATQIAEEVCATPAQPRGAELVQPSASSELSVQLPSTQLAEGRYVLVARSYSCPGGAETPAPASEQGVLELSGCVLRRTLIGEVQEEPALVEVFELSYAAEGLLGLERRCPLEQASALQAAYGFDGERLQIGPLRGAAGAPAASSDAPCDTLDTWELR